MIYLTHLNKYCFNNFLGKMSNIYFNNYDKTKMQSVEVRYHDEQLGGVIIMTYKGLQYNFQRYLKSIPEASNWQCRKQKSLNCGLEHCLCMRTRASARTHIYAHTGINVCVIICNHIYMYT